MKGDPEVIERLNRYLGTELTGHKQYMLHAARCRRWGYSALYERQQAYSHEESAHAARILARILLLEGEPRLSDAREVPSAPSVEAQLRLDRDLVAGAIALLQESIALCRARGDDGTRDLLDEMLEDEETHLDWLEVQLGLIETLGSAHYLQAMM